MKILLSCLLFLDLFVIVSCISISVSIGTLPPSQLPTDFVTMVNLAILLGKTLLLLVFKSYNKMSSPSHWKQKNIFWNP